MNFKIKQEKAYQRLVWQYDKTDFEDFRAELTAADFESCFNNNDIDEICLNWTETFLNSARTFIPNRTVTIRPNDTPWYTNELRLLKRKVQRTFRKFKRTSNDNDWEKIIKRAQKVIDQQTIHKK